MNFLIATLLVLSSIAYASTKAKDTPSSAAGFQAIHPGTSQTISVGTTSVKATNAVAASTSLIRLHCSEDAYVGIGTTGVAATSSSMFVPADQTEYFGIEAGKFVAALRVTASGTCYLTEGK